ncbi:MAG: DEAD/DEAH box helicase [Lactobacillales bacterium]|jgi:superfamily II DNA or RNA helicase|nr:DEAD/DEAH box helicase [Lactobacillales bacterium]
MKSLDIKAVYEKYPSLFDNALKFDGFLRDLFPKDVKQRNQLLMLYKMDIVEYIRSNGKLDSKAVKRFEHKLENEQGLGTDDAKIAVSSFALFESIDEIKESYVPSDIYVDDFTLDDFELLDEVEYLDDFEQFINPTIPAEEVGIIIPCGWGAKDYGFKITGIEQKYTRLGSSKIGMKSRSIYALVFNYLVRNKDISKLDLPFVFKNKNLSFDYYEVFKIAILILQLLENENIDSDRMNLETEFESEIVENAIELINGYAKLFSSFSGYEVKDLILDKRKSAIKIGDDIKFEALEKRYHARHIWVEPREIIYKLTEKNRENFEILLQEISPYLTFKDGQFEALLDVLNVNKDAICVMPTGSGKSLIFYLASLLQPKITTVIVPTDILLKDQIRNLSEIHNFDNVTQIALEDREDFIENGKLFNSLVYVTAKTLQTYDVLKFFKESNNHIQGKSEHSVGTIVLDEVHCLSNLGHDFKPEYLMLTTYLERYLDKANFIGYTATADYTVVKDLIAQLGIKDEEKQVISRLKYDRAINYKFEVCIYESEMQAKAVETAKRMAALGKRSILFTKDDSITEKLVNEFNWEADYISHNNAEAYENFVKQNSKILITTNRIGVGINFANVHNVIHCGMPTSKNQFVQEIGRAGRGGEKVNSFVYYLDKNKAPKELFKREQATLKEPSDNSDYAKIVEDITNGLYSKIFLKSTFDAFVRQFEQISPKKFCVKKGNEQDRKFWYLLWVVGLLINFYYYGAEQYILDVGMGLKDNRNVILKRMKRETIEYLKKIGNYSEEMSKINQSTDIESLTTTFASWYFDRYVYVHKEMFLDFFEFIENSTNKESFKISEEIADFFELPFTKIGDISKKIKSMSVEQIIEEVVGKQNTTSINNVERANAETYDVKLDIYLFIAIFKKDYRFDDKRYDRIAGVLNHDEFLGFDNCLIKIFKELSEEQRLITLNSLNEENVINIMDKFYKYAEKDIIFYALVAKRIKGEI